MTPPRSTFDFGALGPDPLTSDWGFSRGLPVDRPYIEAFLERHAADIRGRVLEVGDDSYTRRFGGERVTQRDVLDILHAGGLQWRRQGRHSECPIRLARICWPDFPERRHGQVCRPDQCHAAHQHHEHLGSGSERRQEGRPVQRKRFHHGSARRWHGKVRRGDQFLRRVDLQRPCAAGCQRRW